MFVVMDFLKIEGYVMSFRIIYMHMCTLILCEKYFVNSFSYD